MRRDPFETWKESPNRQQIITVKAKLNSTQVAFVKNGESVHTGGFGERKTHWRHNSTGSNTELEGQTLRLRNNLPRLDVEDMAQTIEVDINKKIRPINIAKQMVYRPHKAKEEQVFYKINVLIPVPGVSLRNLNSIKT